MMSLLLCAILFLCLAACGSGSSGSGGSGTILPGSDDISRPPIPLRPAYLTGLQKGDDYPEGQRICAVMVNNITKARPTRGLSEAKIVFEIKVEGGITRFMAMYEDYKTIPEVGSVRSARDQFLQLLIPTWGFYVHEGPHQNQPTNWMLRDYEYGELDLQPNLGGLAWRDQDRLNQGYATEYTMYTDGEHITNVIEKNNLDTQRTYISPIFSFVPYNEPARELEGGNLDEIGIIHSASYRTIFHYNNGNNYYDMSQYNASAHAVQKSVDENTGEQLHFDNVIVLFAPMTLYSNSPLVKVDYGNIGIGFYFSGGQYEIIRWAKGAPDQPLRLLVNDDTETGLLINPGTSYVAVVDDAEQENFYNTVMQGNGAEVAGEGTAVTSESDPNEFD